MHLLAFATASLVTTTCVFAQLVPPPLNTDYHAEVIGLMPGINSYGGTAFVPGSPDVLLVSPYGSGQVVAVQLVRDGNGHITGFASSTVAATVPATDGGLAFGPGNVLFGTAYSLHSLWQLEPGSTSPDRDDALAQYGANFSVGACTFVPAGLPGAGRCKLVSYNANTLHDLPLNADGAGTYAPGNVQSSVVLTGGPEGLVYVPAGMPQLGGQLLVAEWNNSVIAAYQVDATGDPLPATRQVVMHFVPQPGGGAVDPVTGDIVFTSSYGLVALRNGALCGTFTSYGPASPGSLSTPTISGSGCAILGQTIQIGFGGAPFQVGVFAFGYYQYNLPWNGLTVLQSFDLLVVIALDGSGTAGLPIAIPANLNLHNLHFYMQSALLDPSTPSGLSTSAGLDLLVR